MTKSEFTPKRIIDLAIPIISEYEAEGIRMTVRQLHYRLVAVGMPNDDPHYKKVVLAMSKARWDGSVGMGAFIDRERQLSRETEHQTVSLAEAVETGKQQVDAWMNAYHRNRWEEQDECPEVWVEKKTLLGVFERVCDEHKVALFACKGYPSITSLYEASLRFVEVENEGKSPVILYFGDFDPSGLDIPRSVEDGLSRLGVDVLVARVALNEAQIARLNLASAPAKAKDRRQWGGKGVVELEAVEPRELMHMCEDAIMDHFDQDAYEALMVVEQRERKEYRKCLVEFVNKRRRKSK